MLGVPTIRIGGSRTSNRISYFDAFVSTWKTDNTGTSDDNQITLPLISTGTYDFDVEWGDGSIDHITAYNQVLDGEDSAVTHTYSEAGTYTVEINSTIKGWQFNNDGDEQKITDISQWGNLIIGTDENYYFYGCSSLDVSATDVLDISGMTRLLSLFRGCSSLTTLNVSTWDMSNITTLYHAFQKCYDLTTLDVSHWDISNVTSLSNAFRECHDLTTLDVSNWDVGNVTTLHDSFVNCQSLTTLDVSNWDVSNVESMKYAFYGCDSMTVEQMGAVKDWDIESLEDATGFMGSSPNSMSIPDYSELLIRWEDQTHQDDVVISFNAAIYDPDFTLDGFAKTAAEARTALVDDGWTITDGGPRSFISIWDTTKTSIGSSNSDQITLPLIATGTYDFLVEWGDGNTDHITAYDDVAITHTYSSAETYEVHISGQIEGWQFANGGDKLKITDISQWGNLIVGTDEGGYFDRCENLSVSATDVLNVSNVTDMNHMFYKTDFNQDIQNWNTINVTNMQNMLRDTPFNQDISNLNTTNVDNMSGMLHGSSINYSLSDLNTTNVDDIQYMLYNCGDMSSVNLGTVKNWTITALTDAGWFLDNCANSMSTADYDELLVNWEGQSHQDNVAVHFNNAKYIPGIVDSGTASSTVGDRLVEAGQNFQTTVSVGDVVHNTTDDTYALVVEVDSDIQLILSSDIMALGDDYVIEGSEAAKARGRLVENDGWTITDQGAVAFNYIFNFKF